MEKDRHGYIVELENVSKSFPGVRALDGVNFRLKSGEVMALLGENGAGKSTLMKILSGVYQRDGGMMRLFGEEIGHLSPKRAQDLGVAIIHQELNMCQHLTVAENMFLGREHTFGPVLAGRRMEREARKILDDMRMDVDPGEVVGRLPVSRQQMVEIAKALSMNAKVLIMDEPTSALTEREIDELFRIILRLKAEGKGIVYISHRLEELKHIVDRVTILRDGKYVTDMDFADTDLPEIIAHMVGREIREKYPRVSCEKGKTVLEVKGLNAGFVRDVSFEAREGEILGFAGLMGAGRTETTRAIFGADPRQSGRIFIDGREVDIRKPVDAIRSGLVLAPEDRKKDGLLTKLSIRANIELPNLDIVANRFGVVRRGAVSEMVRKAKDSFDIRMAGDMVPAGSLSGGNQQKVVIGKWLSRPSRVVIFDEPTRGVDVAAKVEIYQLMNRLKQQGVCVIFVSSELPEVLGIADRIIVMCGGRITGELDIGEATQEKILELATRFEPVKDGAGGAAG
ncbi:MAG: sugar ABC transporter ATP-binding protein [Clostridiales bacterium]|nr:sugar ABC transporter ATP-binding protein [Clostridiales bacterium]